MKKPVIGITPYRKSETGERYMPEGYVKGIEAIDCEMRVIDYMTFDLEKLPALAEELDGMIFSGGPDVDPVRYGETDWPEAGSHVPQRDELEIRLLKLLLPKNTPVLGICRGLQIINAGMGGTLVQHVPKVYGCVHQQAENDPPFVHEVTLTPGSRTATIFGTEKLMTNSYHHQSAREVAPGLVAVGKAGEVIEALEMPGDRFLVCLQWHPEKTLGMDEYSILPFRALRKAIDENR